MKNLFLTIFVSLVILNISAQNEISKNLTLDNLINLMEISNEDANKWLTENTKFAFFSKSNKYNGSIYAYDYDEQLKTAPMWLYNLNKINELFLIAKKNDIIYLIEQLEDNKFVSNTLSDGTMVTTYTKGNKDIIITILNKTDASVRFMAVPENESATEREQRHNYLVRKI